MSEKEIKELTEKVDELTKKIEQLMDIILDDIDVEEDMEMSEKILEREDWQRWLS